MLLFLAVTALVTVGAVFLFVLLDPRTPPWVWARLVDAWNAIAAFFSGLIGR